MNEKFPHLFEPIKIGKTTVKNRIFMPPISTNMADKGYVTDALVEHYSARAKGGVGLIVTEVTTVEPVYTYLPGDMSIYDDSYIPGWKKLVDAVHQYDTKILAQLFHSHSGRAACIGSAVRRSCTSFPDCRWRRS